MIIHKVKSITRIYPGQYWLIFWGLLISTIGTSMIWPFLTIYLSKKLELPLTSISLLLTANAASGVVSSFITGPIIDRFGRKWVLVASLFAFGLVYLSYNFASTYPQFMLVMIMSGTFNPMYRVVSDTMLADIIPPEQRPEAYSLLRLINNVGVAIGPAVGGFIASVSYSLAFYLAAGGLIFYSLLMLIFSHETLLKNKEEPAEKILHVLAGYLTVIQDKRFIFSSLAFTLVAISSTTVWVLMPIYTNTHFNISEAAYGFLPTANAIMIVLFQFFITRKTKKYPPLLVMAIGGFFYASGTLSVAWGYRFEHFLGSMIIVTIGELVLFSVSSAYISDMAPQALRGRYMSVFTLTWSIAYGLAPVLGGLLNDHLGPVTIWFGGSLIGFTGMVLYLVLFFFSRSKKRIVSLQLESSE